MTAPSAVALAFVDAATELGPLRMWRRVIALVLDRFGDAAYRRGFEAAAQWHHDRSADCDRDATKQDEYRWKDQFQREAGFHRYCRDRFRALASPQEGKSGDFTRWRGAFKPFEPPEWPEDDPPQVAPPQEGS